MRPLLSLGMLMNMGSRVQKGGQSTLRPVTIKQIIGADQPHPDADFQIDGVDVGSVSHLERLDLFARSRSS